MRSIAFVVALLSAQLALAGDPLILETANYQVVGHVTPNLKTIAKYLEQNCADFMGRFRGPRGPGGRMRVRLFASGEAIAKRSAAATSTPGRDTYAGLYWPADKELWLDATLEDDDRLFEIIRHEGFHQFLDFHYGRVIPSWMNEGIAMYFDRARRKSGKLEHGWAQRYDVEKLREKWHTAERAKIDWLIQTDYDAFHAKTNEWMNYRVAWLFCAWIIEDTPGSMGTIAAFFRDRARDPTTPFAGRIGKDVATVEAALRAKLDAYMERAVENEVWIPPAKRKK